LAVFEKACQCTHSNATYTYEKYVFDLLKLHV